MPRRVLRGEDEEEALLIIMIFSFFVSFQMFLGQNGGLAGHLFKTRTTAGWRGDLECEKEQSPNLMKVRACLVLIGG